MPLLTINTNTHIDDKTALAKAASHTVAGLLGKPESYVMIQIEDHQCLIFGGEESPCALLQLKSLGLPENSTADFSSRLCNFINEHTGIDSQRIYIEFSSPQRHMWGWDQRTF